MRPYRRARLHERLRRFGVLSSAISQGVVSISLARSRQLTGSVPMGIRADGGIRVSLEHRSRDVIPMFADKLG